MAYILNEDNMLKHHEATGRLRTTDEVKREIEERRHSITRLGMEMKDLQVTDPVWVAKKQAIDRHTSIIAVLRWVLGEDMLWE